MADTDPVSTTLASATNTARVHGKLVDVHLYDSSSFSGTWQIRRYINGRACVVESGTAANLPYDAVVDNAKAHGVDVNISAYTSGTLGVEIA